ncbi:MAG: hypothetical protein N2258_01765 [Brevinematales bacterium]|nr:hypothetical protein [Brevinematales bacterium]
MYKVILFFFISISFCFSSEDLIKITQLFEERKFADIASNYSLEYIISNKEFFTDTGIYIYSKALFALEDFTNALKAIKNIENQSEEIKKLRFFIFLNLNNITTAKKEIINFKEPDKSFLNSLISFIENDIKNATNYLKQYIESEDDKNFNFEALLLDYTLNFKKDLFPKTIEVILKKSIIESTPLIESKTKKSPLNDFIIYKKCLSLIKENKKEEAKNILSELIKNSDSLIIKNLSSYEYQQLN